MKLIVMLSRHALISVNVKAIAAPDDRYIFIAERKPFLRCSMDVISHFDEVHVLDSLEMSTAVPIIDRCIQSLGPQDTLHIVTNDELSLTLNAELNAHYGLEGIQYEKAQIFRKKDIMKSMLKDSGLTVPKFFTFDKKAFLNNREAYIDENISSLRFPLIVKPLEALGGVCVKKIVDEKELYLWMNDILNSRVDYEIEEFYSGKVYNCDLVVKDNNILFFSPCEYMHPVLKFCEGKALGLIHLSKNDERWAKLHRFGEILIDRFKPDDGVNHFEAIETGSGEFVFIEIAARPSGGLVTNVEEKNNGFNYEMLHFKLRLGLPVEVKQKQSGDYYAWAMYPTKKGRVVELLTPDLKSECEWDWYVEVGEKMETAVDISDINYFSGSLIYHHSDYNQLYEDFLTLRQFDPIVVE